MGHTWVRHRVTGGYWQCPDEALDDMRELGWEPSDPPEEPNPVVAERIAWEQQIAERQQAEEQDIRRTTRAARRGETQKEG